MSGQHVMVNGVKLGVEVRGGENPRKNILVLLHGFTRSASAWSEHLDAFAKAGMRVIALDMLGHGRSDAPDDPARYSIEHCCEDILAALRELDVKQGEATLLGYSMGGRIALYTALSAFFRALILESASPGLADPRERAARRASDEQLANRIEREGIAAFVDYWEQLPLFASQHALPLEQRMALRTQRLANNGRGLANSLRGVGTGAQPALHAWLPQLNVPTLLIAGQLDSKFCASAREMASVLPRAQLRIVANVGHTVHLESPRAFDALVIDFVTSQA